MGATAIDLSPTAPDTTIFYTRQVTSGLCSTSLSNPIKLTVNPSAIAEITYNKNKGCVPFQLDAGNVAAALYPDRNNIYTWLADNVQIGVGAIFPRYTLLNGNETVIIKLVVTSNLGCNADEMNHPFSTLPVIIPSFTQSVDQDCGPVNVTFTNTSSSITGATFKWDFGNGTISNLAQPPPVTYQPDQTGKDITYTITLETSTPCGPPIIKTSTVLVKGKAVSIFSPDKTAGCSPLAVNFSNTSPESPGITYTYDFGDGSAPAITTDRSSVNHLFTTLVVKDFVVTMVAENVCGKNMSSYTVRVSPNDITPELVVNAEELQGCASFAVNFYNNTKGASRFVYDFGDGTGNQVTNSAPEIVSHTFKKAGTYTVTLYASNNCSNAQTTEKIIVLEQPTVGFRADRTTMCYGTVVKFTNTCTNAIGYLWDFGDGKTSNEFEPQHTYIGSNINYMVTLTSTNLQGCTNTISIQDYINIVAPAVAIFTVNPRNELSIPNYTFRFKDISMGSVSWE